MAISLVSWNCQSYRQNIPDVKDIIDSRGPAVFCLQETFLKPTDTTRLKGYHTIRKDYLDGARSCGGVAMLISNDFPSCKLQLHTCLQAVGIRIQLNELVTICCIYLPPNHNFRDIDLQQLIDQLPPPFSFLEISMLTTQFGVAPTPTLGEHVLKK